MYRPRTVRTLAVASATAAAIGLGAVGIFLGLLALLDRATGGLAQRWDHGVLEALAGYRTAAGMEIALDVTALGNTLTLSILLAWCCLALWLAGRTAAAAFVPLVFVGGRLVTEIMKLAFDRPRPDVLEWGVHVTSAAFPSAHAMSAAVAYGALAYVVARPPLPGTVRVAAWCVAVLLVMFVGASRVYLGVHHPSDVLAGAAAGGLWLAAAAIATGRTTRRLRGHEIRAKFP